MNIIDIEIGKLKPYAKNAKKHDEKQIQNLMESLRQFGFKRPEVIDSNYEIIIGHGIYEAAKRLGYKTIPCLIADDLTEEQAKKLRNLDNKLNESEWDFDLLGEDILGLDFSGFDIDWGLGDFDFTTEEVEEDEFDETLPVNPVSELGDVWKCGRHYVMCGDSTNAENVRTLMHGEKCNLLLTDPPYNVDYEGVAGKIQNDSMKNDEFIEFLTKAFSNANESMNDGATFYIWHADSMGFEFRTACANVKWKIRECLIWKKDSMVLGRQDYQWIHEPCLYGWKEGTHHWYSDRSQTTVLEFVRPKKNDLHPTMKPVELFDYQMKNSSKKGDIVLDLFGGSGTSLVVAEQNGRTAYLMEFDTKYCDVIVRRWEKLTGQKAECLTHPEKVMPDDV